MRSLRISLLFFVFQIHLFSQSEKLLNTDSLLTDLSILRTTLEENHPLVFEYVSKGQFDKLSSNLQKEIAAGQTASQFQASLSRYLGQMGCGHTLVYPSETTSKKLLANNDLPFDIVILNDSIFISQTYGTVDKNYSGAAITAINHLPAKVFLESAFSIISADGHNTGFKKSVLKRKFNYYVNEVFNFPDSLMFSTTKCTFVVKFPTRFTREEEEENLPFFKPLADIPGTLLLSLPNFDEGRGTIKKCFRFINKNKVEHLIIDLRENGGGNGNIGSYLLSYLIDTTIVYYLDKKTTPVRYGEYLTGGQGFMISNLYEMKDSSIKSYYFKVRPRKKTHFDGKVYVLINGAVFSTAAYVASFLEQKTGAVFIGEETGGSHHAIGGGVIKTLNLPYSQTRIKFPMYKWIFDSTTPNTGRGTMPDVAVRYTIQDVLEHTDLEYKKAKELIGIKGN